MSNSENEASVSELEVLHGIRLDDVGLHVWVTSNGCTTAEDFHLDVNLGTTGESVMHVAIHRMKRDVCKMMPHTVEVTFPLSTFNPRGKDMTSFTLENKVGKPSD